MRRKHKILNQKSTNMVNKQELPLHHRRKADHQQQNSTEDKQGQIHRNVYPKITKSFNSHQRIK